MMPIHGSVHDVHTILGDEEEEYFPPNFKEYIQKEQLNLSRFGHKAMLGRPTLTWVLWSQQDHQTQLDDFADLIRQALQKLISREEFKWGLVQFWAPTKTSEGRTLLKTQFQPFAIGVTSTTKERNKLCKYRMGMCREYNYFYADAESGEEQRGLPGRVFLNQLPESTPDVKYYTRKEYPQHDLAKLCGIGSSWAEPVFDHSSRTCVGVLEIVSLALKSSFWHDKSFLGQMYDIFQKRSLLCFDGYKHYEMQIGDKNEARKAALQELKTVLTKVCEINGLTLAKTWVPCSACNGLVQGQLMSEAMEFCGCISSRLDAFAKVSKCSHLGKGGVAGMVLSSPNMLYCSDITQLSSAEYPLVVYARLCKFRGWFTLCLQSNRTANDIYVLEFFLPTSSRWGDNSQTSLSLILGTMKKNFKTFKLASGQKLGDLLSVEVMDFQNGPKHHSVEKIQAKGRGVMLQPGHLDQLPMDAISKETNVVSEAQNDNLPSLDSLQNGKVTTQVDSSNQPSMDASSNGQNVVTAERNIFVVSSSKEHERKTQDRKYKKGGPRIDIPKEKILKCSHMNRKDAAEKLGVGISTFKRVCRGHGIERWSPCNIEKIQPSLPSSVENQGQTPQLNFDFPSNQASVGISTFKRVCRGHGIDRWPPRNIEKIQPSLPSSLENQRQTPQLNFDFPLNQTPYSVANIKTGFQDADTVTIKAKCEMNTIKFRLSLSSTLGELQQQVAKRLELKAGTYHIKYKDEKDDLILIAHDEDLHDCIQCFRSPGNNDIYITLEKKLLNSF